MRRAWWGPPTVLLTAGLLAACSETVTGTAAPAGPAAPRMVTTQAATGVTGALVADAVADECLLNASELGSLLKRAVRPPVQSTIPHADGSSGSSCVVTADAEPIAMINVYRAGTGVPADYIAPGSHPVSGAGDAAGVVTTDAGPMLQLATRGYLVTILVAGGPAPADDAWRKAAAAALTRLPP
ncbi:hypothetical protein [Pseudonocardia sp. GCM10023141]|uniref:hypothetical protein n=1 Tax=Pseudonocardia sp. GCM10023141 TaxID=3252653 RepID=UPI003615331F